MAFPDAPLCPKVAIFYDLTWHDISGDVDGRADIVIRHGRADEASTSDPSECTLVLKNPDGKYSPRNPLSPLHGKIGRNTPLRVQVGEPSPEFRLPGIFGGYASTPDAPSLDITGDLDVRVEVEPYSWRPDFFMVLASKYNFKDDQRSWIVGLSSSGFLNLTWSVDGSDAGRDDVVSNVAVPADSGRLALRVTLDVDNGAGGSTATFYTAPDIDGPWTQLGSAVVTSGVTSIFASDIQLAVGAGGDGGAAFSSSMEFRGVFRSCEVRNGIDGPLVAAPDFTTLSAGDDAFTDSVGLPWTIHTPAAVVDPAVRFSGEVSAWPSRWESELDVTVPVEASGMTRRLGQGSSPLQSALRRGMLSDAITAPVAYWSCEDGAGATQFASAFDGHPALLRTAGEGVKPADWDDAPATSAIPTYTTGSARGTVPTYPDSGFMRLMVFVSFPDTLDAGEHLVMEARTTGSSRSWKLWINEVGGLVIRAYDVDNNEILESGSGFALLGKTGLLWIYLIQDGGDVDWQLGHTDADTGVTGVLDATLAGRTFGRASGVAIGPGDLEGTAIGHVVVLDTAEFFDIVPFARAWTGEAALDRVIRLASEEAVPLTGSVDTGRGEKVGPQRPKRFLDLVQEAAEADLGVLSDRRDSLGLHYRARTSLYNQEPALILDYDAGQAYAPLEPEDDDQRTRNDVTVSREGGSSSRAVRLTGPLSIQAPPVGVGRYDDAVTLNLRSDAQVQDQAGWRLHLGTVDEARYPKVRLNLHRSPELIDAAKRVELGDRIAIRNPPPWLPPEAIDLIAQGYTETLNATTWDIVWNCTPGSAWTVGVLDDPVLGRADTDGSQLVVAADSDDTVLLVGRTGDVDEDFEDTDLQVVITGTWVRSQTSPHAGVWCFASADIGDGENSDAFVRVPDGASRARFWYRVSSEEGFDFLRVYVDSVEVLAFSGEVPWTLSPEVAVTPGALLLFRYIKDASVSEGEDAAFIDNLVFRGPGAWPLWTTDPAEMPIGLIVGGEQVTATAIGSPTADTFDRTVDVGWGTATTGQAWTTTGGSATDFSVGGV